MEFPSARLLVFARAPQTGTVKTRLIPALGETGAAQLHARMADVVLGRVSTSALCPVELWCSPSPEHPWFMDRAQHYCITLHRQVAGDLGTRMQAAAIDALQRADHVALIGTDCPELCVDDLRGALTSLQSGTDAVLGPAADGGYYLLGLRRTAPELFRDIAWGTGTVLEETRARLHGLGWRWAELPTRRDVDRPEDLACLRAQPVLAELLTGIEVST